MRVLLTILLMAGIIFPAQSQIIETLAGNGEARAEPFHFMSGFTLDQKGTLYVVAEVSGSTSIFQIDTSTGKYEKLFTSFGLEDVEIGKDGLIYFIDRHRLGSINPVTKEVKIIAGSTNYGYAGDGGPAENALFQFPTSIEFDNQGNIYVSELTRIRKIDKQTSIITTVASELKACEGFAIDNKGNIYTAENNIHQVRKVDQATGIKTVIAGTGIGDYSKDGIPATQASLYAPRDVKIDNQGNLYVLEYYGQKIRKIDNSTGLISTLIGNGMSSPKNVGVSFPIKMNFDGDNNLLFTDRGNKFVRNIDLKTGMVSDVAGVKYSDYSGDGMLATSASLFEPWDVTTDKDGNLYIADQKNNAIRRVDKNTNIISTVVGSGSFGRYNDGLGAKEAQLSWPRSIDFDKEGNMYIADYFNNRIRKIDKASGIIQTIAGKGPAIDPPGVPFPEDGDIALESYLAIPQSIAVNSEGDVFFISISIVFKLDVSTGLLHYYAGKWLGGSGGGDGGPATEIRLNSPQGIDLDKNGNLYIAGPGYVRWVNNETGIINRVPGVFGNNKDVHVDNEGNLFVVQDNKILFVEKSTGNVSTIAGSDQSGFEGDGDLAINARFSDPTGIHVDEQGNVYIADLGNNRIRTISKSDIEAKPSISGFTLINPKTNQDIRRLEDLDYWFLPDLWRTNVRADAVNPELVKSVAFEVNGRRIRTENAAPYALGGDRNGDYMEWDVQRGVYTICATPYSEPRKGGIAGETKCVNLSLIFTLPELLEGSGIVHAAAGSYSWQPEASGMANYDFNATYDHNTREFGGMAEVHFSDLMFMSTDIHHFYQRTTDATTFWYGAINGEDDYMMRLRLVYRPNKTLVRIIITQRSTGEIIFDTERNLEVHDQPTLAAMDVSNTIGEPIRTIIDDEFREFLFINELSVYPNPFNNRITLELPANEELVDITIVDLQGRVMITESLEGGRVHEVNTTALANGVYILRVEMGDEVESVRILKE